jgi:hypothetical protein
MAAVEASQGFKRSIQETIEREALIVFSHDIAQILTQTQRPDVSLYPHVSIA